MADVSGLSALILRAATAAGYFTKGGQLTSAEVDANMQLLADSIKLVNDGLILKRTAKISISSADILGIEDTPVELIPAQGPNTIIVPHSVVVKLIWNSVAYATNVSLYVRLGATEISNNILINSSSDTISMVELILSTYQNLDNLPLYLSTLDAALNPTAGNSTLEVIVEYTVVDFS